MLFDTRVLIRKDGKGFDRRVGKNCNCSRVWNDSCVAMSRVGELVSYSKARSPEQGAHALLYAPENGVRAFARIQFLS
jgi:hypothetical protein